jgi:hypothetical protein
MGIEDVEIDFLILADRAEILNGKLYMMGGAWDRRTIRDIKVPVGISMVIGVLVPWTLTNQQHNLQIKLVDGDGNTIGQQAAASIAVGRPIGATAGQSFRAMAVINGRWTLPGYGAYSAIVTVSDRTEKRVVFYAVEPSGEPGG